MGIWTDIATWVGPTINCGDGDGVNEPGDRITDHMYVVEHIAVGTYAGTIAWQRNPDANVSSHFIVAKDGRCAQMVDTSIRAWTQKSGNPFSVSIENEGWLPDALTPQQIEKSAQILARAHQVHGIPLQLTGTVGVPGLGHHSMGAESGVDWGHSACPGSAIKNQKPLILARAIAIVNGDDVNLTDLIDLPYEQYPEVGTQRQTNVEGALAYTLARSLRQETQMRELRTQVSDLVAAVNGLTEQVSRISTSGVDPQVIEDAAFRGAQRAEDE